MHLVFIGTLQMARFTLLLHEIMREQVVKEFGQNARILTKRRITGGFFTGKNVM